MSGYTDWRALWGEGLDRFRKRRKEASGGPKILLATGVGGHIPMAVFDALLASALTMRGADVHVLLCDACLPACEKLTFDTSPGMEFFRPGGSPSTCEACLNPALALFESLGVTIHRYGDTLAEDERLFARETASRLAPHALASYALDGLRVGEHALAGALRFFAKDELSDEPRGEEVLRRYFEAALLTAFSVRRLLGRIAFTRASFHHGIYVPQGIVGEAARAAGVAVANWVVAYRKRCFLFSHGDTYHHTLMDEPSTVWEGLRMTPELLGRTDAYLRGRWSGEQDWIYFHEGAMRDADRVRAELGLDPAKPLIGLLTNVVWDAQLHYPANAFAGMTQWVERTIEYFSRRPDLNLAIRVHPAELRGGVPSRRKMAEVVARRFGKLPGNITLVGPESDMSTYALMNLCDAGLIYGTKTGVELTAMGIPTIVAGEAWIRGKGLTLDASSPEQYEALLDRLPLGRRLGPDVVDRAKKYAFHFFFRRMIPVKWVSPRPGWPPFTVEVPTPEDLLPGRDAGLDVIADGLLHGTPFVYPAEIEDGHDR